jgi:hypothetical protein
MKLPLKVLRKQLHVGISVTSLHSRDVVMPITAVMNTESPHMAGFDDRLSGEKKPADLSVAG